MSVVNYVCINVEVTDIFLTLNPKPSSTDVFDDTSMVTLLHLDIQHSRSRKSSPAPLDEVWLVGERARARERATGRVRGRMCEGGRGVVGKKSPLSPYTPPSLTHTSGRDDNAVPRRWRGEEWCVECCYVHTHRELHALRHPHTHWPFPTFTFIFMYTRSTCVYTSSTCVLWHAHYTHMFIHVYMRARAHTHTHTYTIYVC